jgi:hypothetical protein
MNDDGSDKYGRFLYHHGDEHGNPSSRPMNKSEIVQMYHDTRDDDPTVLADLYLDFHQFDRIEFLIFKDRLAASILVANSAKQSLENLEHTYKKQKADKSHHVKGWEGEMDMVLDEQLWLVENSYTISIGASTVAAVAALESLLIDLVPEGKKIPKGLHDLLKAFLEDHKVPKSNRKHLIGQELKIGKRRNIFAHTLTGSYFSNDKSVKELFTEQNWEDTLFTVADIAIQLEEIELEGKVPSFPPPFPAT